jgi:hypothetical protein
MVLIAASQVTTAPRRYKVELAYIGYTGLAESADCDSLVNQQGYDSLIGTVQESNPTNNPDDDAIYEGIVRRKTAIDYCLTRPKSAATPDELVLCVLRLTGSADMKIEIKVHTDAGTGAYLHAEPFRASPLVSSPSATGNCTPAETDEVRRSYPGGSSGGSPDGQSLLDPTGTQFVLNNMPALRKGYSPPDPPVVTWGMRVTPLP